MQTKAASTPASQDSTLGKTEFDATAAERAAIDEVVPHYFDLATAFELVNSKAPQLAQFDEAFDALPSFDKSLPRRAVTYAHAALHAAVLEQFAPANMNDAETAAIATCIELYPKFASTAQLLAAEKLLPATVLSAPPVGTSHRERAHGLHRLVFIFREHESAVVNNSIIKRETIETAAKAVAIALPAFSDRTQPSEAQRAAQRERQKCVMLLFHAWNQTRRAMHWLRWEEQDADQWAPSLYAQRASRSEKAKTDERDDSERKPTEPAQPAQPAQPAPKPLVPQDDPFIR